MEKERIATERENDKKWRELDHITTQKLNEQIRSHNAAVEAQGGDGTKITKTTNNASGENLAIQNQARTAILNSAWQKNKNPDTNTLNMLVQQTGMTKDQVQKWFNEKNNS